jgi:hypothetical protein
MVDMKREKEKKKTIPAANNCICSTCRSDMIHISAFSVSKNR